MPVLVENNFSAKDLHWKEKRRKRREMRTLVRSNFGFVKKGFPHSLQISLKAVCGKRPEMTMWARRW